MFDVRCRWHYSMFSRILHLSNNPLLALLAIPLLSALYRTPLTPTTIHRIRTPLTHHCPFTKQPKVTTRHPWLVYIKPAVRADTSTPPFTTCNLFVTKTPYSALPSYNIHMHRGSSASVLQVPRTALTLFPIPRDVMSSEIDAFWPFIVSYGRAGGNRRFSAVDGPIDTARGGDEG